MYDIPTMTWEDHQAGFETTQVLVGMGYDELFPEGLKAPDGSIAALVSQFEKQIIEQVLAENAWQRAKTAKALVISRMTLFNKMRKYGIVSPRG